MDDSVFGIRGFNLYFFDQNSSCCSPKWIIKFYLSVIILFLWVLVFTRRHKIEMSFWGAFGTYCRNYKNEKKFTILVTTFCKYLGCCWMLRLLDGCPVIIPLLTLFFTKNKPPSSQKGCWYHGNGRVIRTFTVTRSQPLNFHVDLLQKLLERTTI